MKKFISFALIAAMAVTTLVGCGNKEAINAKLINFFMIVILLSYFLLLFFFSFLSLLS